jgi:hypothetical protein
MMAADPERALKAVCELAGYARARARPAALS